MYFSRWHHFLKLLILGSVIVVSLCSPWLCARSLEITVQETEKEDTAAAESAARSFLEGCAANDWDKAQPFWRKPLDDRAKLIFGGLTIISIGKAKYHALSTSVILVKCKIRYKRDVWALTRTLNLKKSKTTGLWQIDGGI